MLENLRVIKAKHTALCSQVKEMAAAQKESMDSIRGSLINAMELIQHLQQTTDVEVQPLTESEQESAELLGSTVSQTTAELYEPWTKSTCLLLFHNKSLPVVCWWKALIVLYQQ
ncbi:hypothetical protein PAMP_007561 [Pampus punctatissimus]